MPRRSGHSLGPAGRHAGRPPGPTTCLQIRRSTRALHSARLDHTVFARGAGAPVPLRSGGRASLRAGVETFTCFIPTSLGNVANGNRGARRWRLWTVRSLCAPR